MKVIRYKKRKNGLYEVELDNNETLFLYEETILDNDILISGINDLDKTIEDNEKYDAYYRALKVIKTRVKSKKEISEKLESFNYKKENIDWAISLLEKQGYINDKRYASSYLNDKLITTSYGPYKIMSELRKKGIREDITNEIIADFTEEEQKEKINKIINRIIKSNRTRSGFMLKKKILTDLINLGYDKEMCTRVIAEYDIVTSKEVLKREYDKLHKKLSKKYSGQDLELMLKKKLYEKGFNISDIN